MFQSQVGSFLRVNDGWWSFLRSFINKREVDTLGIATFPVVQMHSADTQGRAEGYRKSWETARIVRESLLEDNLSEVHNDRAK